MQLHLYLISLFGSFQKIVKVQIREDLTQAELLTRLASNPLGIPFPVTEPLTKHLVKPMTKPPSTKVELRNKTVTFPTTEPGGTSGIMSQDYLIQMSTDIMSVCNTLS